MPYGTFSTIPISTNSIFNCTVCDDLYVIVYTLYLCKIQPKLVVIRLEHFFLNFIPFKIWMMKASVIYSNKRCRNNQKFIWWNFEHQHLPCCLKIFTSREHLQPTITNLKCIIIISVITHSIAYDMPCVIGKPKFRHRWLSIII